MSIERRYRCDLCGEQPPGDKPGLFRGGQKLAGISLDLDGIKEQAPEKADTHLCWRCIAAIQSSLHRRCGAGYEGCTGGPNCGADHK